MLVQWQFQMKGTFCFMLEIKSVTKARISPTYFLNINKYNKKEAENVKSSRPGSMSFNRYHDFRLFTSYIISFEYFKSYDGKYLITQYSTPIAKIRFCIDV